MKIIYSSMALFSLLWSQFILAGTWPVKQFQVFEGEPWGSQYEGTLEAGKSIEENISLDDEKLASPRLTSQLKQEIESYLAEVAGYYERYFPPPSLEPEVTREDGAKAFRIYYLNDVPDKVPALYVSSCNPAGRRIILVNATELTKNGSITAKGYADLAHELFHAVQRNTTVGKKNCDPTPGGWLYEGQAQAIGIDMAWKFRSKVPAPASRWGLRDYSKRLYVPPEAKGELRRRGYATASLWRYLAERNYLQKYKNRRGDPLKPGPKTGPGYGVDWGYLNALLGTPINGSGDRAELQWLDEWLLDNFKAKFYNVYIDFISVFTEYGHWRVTSSKLSDAQKRRRWREGVFGGDDAQVAGCSVVRLGKLRSQDVQMRVELPPVATRCIELDVGDTKQPLSWELQITAENGTLLKQIRVAMANGHQIYTSAPLIDPVDENGVVTGIPDTADTSGAIADWPIILVPNKKQHLLLANIAQNADATREQEIYIRISLDKSLGSAVPAPPPRRKAKRSGKVVQPGPAGAKDWYEKLRDETPISSTGSGATGIQFQPRPVRCPADGWRIDCEPSFKIILGFAGLSPGGYQPWGSNASGSLEAIGFSKNLVEELVKNDGWKYDTAGSTIELTVPGIDYGFTGTVSDSLIEVSSGKDIARLVSLGPEPGEKSPPCKYGPPVGVVTIDEFSLYVISGSYSGVMIKGGSPRDVKRCPRREIIKTVSGTFRVVAPWMQDRRIEVNTDWMQEDQTLRLLQLLPPGMSVPLDMPGLPAPLDQSAPAPAPEFSGSASGYSDDDFQFSRADCECSCDEFRAAMQAGQNMMSSGGEPQRESLRLMSCMEFCMADVSDCSF